MTLAAGSTPKPRTAANLQCELMIAEAQLYLALVKFVEEGLVEKMKACLVVRAARRDHAVQGLMSLKSAWNVFSKLWKDHSERMSELDIETRLSPSCRWHGAPSQRAGPASASALACSTSSAPCCRPRPKSWRRGSASTESACVIVAGPRHGCSREFALEQLRLAAAEQSLRRSPAPLMHTGSRHAARWPR